MKKIIYIASVRMPTEKAHGIQIMEMCSAFAKQGFSIELIVPRRQNYLNEKPFDYYGLEPVFAIKKLPCLDLLRIIKGPLGSLVTTLSFLFVTKTYLLFKNYDFLYTREELAVLFFKKIFLEVHNISRLFLFTKNLIQKKSSGLIVLTSFIKEELIHLGFERNKILVAPDGVNLEDFEINLSKEEVRKKLSLPLDKKIIAYTGSFRLYEWKGVDVLLEASLSFGDDCLLMLVGVDDLDRQVIEKRFGPDKILLVDRKPHKEIPYYLKAADVLILPNKKGYKMSENYTSPLKLFEYMASGVPIVASNLPSLREILNENDCYFFESNNSKSLSATIKKAIFDQRGVSKVCSAYNKVRNYNWEKRSINILNFFNL